MDTLNYVDYTFLFIFFAYLLMGFQRGLVKQVLSLITLAVALIVAVMFSSNVANQFMTSASFQNLMTNMSASIGANAEQPVSYLVLGISFVLIFLGVMIVGGLINYVISSIVSGTGLGFVNRIFGGLFGLLRGAVVVLVLIFILQLTSVGNQPWWSQSRVVVTYQPAVEFLANAVSPELANLKDKLMNTVQGMGAELEEYSQTMTR